MTTSRDDVLHALARAAEYRFPMRWVTDATAGDFDGVEAAFDVFNVPVAQQRHVLSMLRSELDGAAKTLGVRPLPVFHTPAATAEHYARVVVRGDLAAARTSAQRALADALHLALHMAVWVEDSTLFSQSEAARGLDGLYAAKCLGRGLSFVVVRYPDWLPHHAHVEDGGLGAPMTFACSSPATLAELMPHIDEFVRGGTMELSRAEVESDTATFYPDSFYRVAA